MLESTRTLRYTQRMITIVIPSYKEPKTIGRTIKCVADRQYTGYEGDFEIIQVSVDKETLDAGMEAAKQLKLKIGQEYKQIVDPHKGKPYALTLAFKEAKGEILVISDGDIYYDKGALGLLVKPLLQDKTIGGTSGQPISADPKDNMMGYWGHLLTAAAHDKRTKDSEFPLSGYAMAFRNLHQEIDPKSLVEDAYISYMMLNAGYTLKYVPEAKVWVNFPQNLRDYFKQKTRSLGGFAPLNKDEVVKNKKHKKQRTFVQELSYMFFPLQYAKSPRELIWSLALYPTRLWTWWLIVLKNWRERNNKDIVAWERIESTK